MAREELPHHYFPRAGKLHSLADDFPRRLIVVATSLDDTLYPSFEKLRTPRRTTLKGEAREMDVRRRSLREGMASSLHAGDCRDGIALKKQGVGQVSSKQFWKTTCLWAYTDRDFLIPRMKSTFTQALYGTQLLGISEGKGHRMKFMHVQRFLPVSRSLPSYNAGLHGGWLVLSTSVLQHCSTWGVCRVFGSVL